MLNMSWARDKGKKTLSPLTGFKSLTSQIPVTHSNHGAKERPMVSTWPSTRFMLTCILHIHVLLGSAMSTALQRAMTSNFKKKLTTYNKICLIHYITITWICLTLPVQLDASLPTLSALNIEIYKPSMIVMFQWMLNKQQNSRNSWVH